MRNKNQAKREKLKFGAWGKRKKKRRRIKKNKRAGWKRNRRQKRKKEAKMAKLKFEAKKKKGQGTSKIWYLKYRISEALERNLRKQCNSNYPTHNQLTKIVKGGERMQIF